MADGYLNSDTTIDSTGYQNSISSLASMVKGVAREYTEKNLVEYLIGSNADMEKTKASLAALFGDAQKGASMMRELEALALKSPFNMNELADAAKTMLTLGAEFQNIIGDLTMLGNISMGEAQKLSSLVLVFGQIQSAGLLTEQHLQKLTEVGFNPLQAIAEKTGESMESLRDKMSDGAISFDMVRQAMVDATSEGGLFYQSMENQAETFTGMMAAMGESATKFGREVGAEAFDALKESAADLMTELERLEKTGELAEIAEDVGSAIAGVVNILTGTIRTVYEMQDALKVAVIAFGAFKAGTALGGIVEAWQTAAVAVKAYSTATATSQHVSLLLASTLSAKELIVGVLTRKISLATAAQLAWNAATHTAAGVFGVVASAVAAVGAAIYFYQQKVNEGNKVIKGYNDAVAKTAEQSRQNVVSVEQEAVALHIKADRYEELRQKMNRAAAEELELKNVAEELQSILPVGTQIIDAQTGAYLALGGAVESVIDSMILQAKIQGEQDVLNTKLEKRQTLQSSYDDADESFKKAYKNYYGVEYGEDIPQGYHMGKATQTIAIQERNLQYWEEELQKRKSVLDENLTAEDVFENSVKKHYEDLSKLREEQNKSTQQQMSEETKLRQEQLASFKSWQQEREKSMRLGEITESQYFDDLGKQLEGHTDEMRGAYYEYFVDLNRYRESSNKAALSSQEKANREALSAQEKANAAMEKLQKESFDEWKDDADAMVSEYASALDRIASMRESLQKKLQSYGSLFSIEEDESGKERTKLADLDKISRTIDEYAMALNTLRANGASDAFLEQFMSYDMDEALKYFDAMSSKGLSSYLDKWQQNQEKAEQIAAEFYQSELNTLNTEFVEKFNGILGEMPADMSKVGTDAMDGFIDGLYSKLTNATDAATLIAGEVVKAYNRRLEINSPSRVMFKAGAFTTEGAVKGIESKLPELRKTLDSLLATPEGAELALRAESAVRMEMADTVRSAQAKTRIAPTGQGPASNTQNINFTQNNSSPKALSRYDIYRQGREATQLLALEAKR